MVYSFFRVIPRRLNSLCRRFETLSHRHTLFKKEKFFLFKRHVKMEQSAPKHWQKGFRSRGITQKKEYNTSLFSFCFIQIFSIVMSPDWRRRNILVTF